jgi:hypothetical protein
MEPSTCSSGTAPRAALRGNAGSKRMQLICDDLAARVNDPATLSRRPHSTMSTVVELHAHADDEVVAAGGTLAGSVVSRPAMTSLAIDCLSLRWRPRQNRLQPPVKGEDP